MRLYWLYDLPNWLFGALTVIVFAVIGLGGLYLTRGWVRRLHGVDHSHNDIVGFYLAAVTVFYGITLGLLAVGTWTTYSEVQGKVDHEAASLGVLLPRYHGLSRSDALHPGGRSAQIYAWCDRCRLADATARNRSQ